MPKFSDLPSASRLDLDNDYLLINIRNGLNNYQTQKITGNDLIYSTCLPNDITNLFESISTLENEINNLDSTSAGDPQTLNALVELLNYDGTDSGHLYRIEHLEDAISQVQGGSGGLTEEQENLLDEIVLFQSFTNDTGGNGVGPFIDNYNNLYNQVQNLGGSELTDFLDNVDNRVNDLEHEIDYFNDAFLGSSSNGISQFIQNYNNLWEDVNSFTEDYGNINAFLNNYYYLHCHVNSIENYVEGRVSNLETEIGFFDDAFEGSSGVSTFINNYNDLYNRVGSLEYGINYFNDGFSGIEEFINNYNELYSQVQNNLDLQTFNRVIELLNYSSTNNGELTRIDNLENITTVVTGPIVQFSDCGGEHLVYQTSDSNIFENIPKLYLDNNPVMVWDATNTCFRPGDMDYSGCEATIGFNPCTVSEYIDVNNISLHATFPIFINTPDGVWNTLNGGLVD